MDDLQRLEEKIKLAHLQIDKRLANLEIELTALQKDVRNIKEELVAMKAGQKAPPAVTAADISDLAAQFKQLRQAFMEMRLRLTSAPAEDLRPEIEELSERLTALEKQVAVSSPVILE